MVATVLKSLGSPCFKSNVTVPEEVGCHVIITELPAVKPVSRVVALKVKALACAETKPTRAARTIEVENCIIVLWKKGKPMF